MRHVTPAVLTALCLALAACGEGTDAGDDPDVDAPTDNNPSGAIANGDYTSSEVTGHTLVPGTGIRLGWKDGQLRLQAGCNTMSGPATVDGGRLRVENLAGTEMGCSPELMEQDTWLVEFVGNGPEIAADDDGFTLAAGQVAIRFTGEQPPEDAPLEGTTWELETTMEGQVASSSVGPDTPVTSGDAPRRPQLRIAQGELRAFDGCNQLFGPVEVGPDSIRTEGLAGTRRACTDPAATRTARLLGELLQESSYDVAGERLTLRQGDVAMVFRANR